MIRSYIIKLNGYKRKQNKKREKIERDDERAVTFWKRQL